MLTLWGQPGIPKPVNRRYHLNFCTMDAIFGLLNQLLGTVTDLLDSLLGGL